MRYIFIDMAWDEYLFWQTVIVVDYLYEVYY
jgi:hypothetical protein